MMSTRIPDAKKQKMREMYKRGHTCKAISEFLNVHENSVKRITKDMRKKKPGRPGVHLEQHLIDEIKELYRYGMSNQQICNELGVSPAAVVTHTRPLRELEKAARKAKREGPQSLHAFDCLGCGGTLNWLLNPDNLLQSWQLAEQRCAHCGRQYRAQQVIPIEALQLDQPAINTS